MHFIAIFISMLHERERDQGNYTTTLRLTAVVLHVRGMTYVQLGKGRVAKRHKMGKHTLSACWRGKASSRLTARNCAQIVTNQREHVMGRTEMERKKKARWEGRKRRR